MNGPTTKSMSTEMADALQKARTEQLNASAAYKRAWREHPTAAGFPIVDKALDRLELAERNVARLERMIQDSTRRG